MEPEDLLDSLSSQRAATVERLRQLVRSAVPEATERIYPVWKGIGYHHPKVGYFCGIFPSGKWVALGFDWESSCPTRNGC